MLDEAAFHTFSGDVRKRLIEYDRYLAGPPRTSDASAVFVDNIAVAIIKSACVNMSIPFEFNYETMVEGSKNR